MFTHKWVSRFWFSRLLQHSARKQGGIIIQCYRAHMWHMFTCNTVVVDSSALMGHLICRYCWAQWRETLCLGQLVLCISVDVHVWHTVCLLVDIDMLLICALLCSVHSLLSRVTWEYRQERWSSLLTAVLATQLKFVIVMLSCSIASIAVTAV